MMDGNYLSKHPNVENAAKRIAYVAGKDLYNLKVCILLMQSTEEVVEAYQYIYRSSKTLVILCDFILYLKRQGVRI